MVYQVFVSSTERDLRRHREAVKTALVKTGYLPVGMEEFGARDAAPVAGCLDLVGEADLFVGIYAWRYGYVPPGAERSITAEELEEARRLDKPRFYFLVDESAPWPAVPGVAEESPESRELLRALKRDLRSERIVASFNTPDELALQVVTALRTWEQAQAPAEDPERREQLELVDQVQRYWINGVLQRTVPDNALLLRDREERTDAVAQPWETAVWTERGEPALLPARTPLDLFVQRGRRLLILGEGGYGKTTELLQLAAGLLERARRDAQQPVPVVLKLASWGRRSRRLADWMVSQIQARHKLDATLVRRWIEGDRLLPLLDGLDEMEPGCRDACARAINEFLAGHPERGLAVTCRSDVVDELSERLDLRDAYALLPLSTDALDRRLAAGGPGAETLRAALAEPGWRELARTPLLLVMIERVLRGAGAAALGATPTVPGASAADAGAARRRVLGAYVKAMLEQPPRPLRYPVVRTRRGLAWLVSEMSAHRLAIFQIDDLQPSWLSRTAHIWLYAVVSRASSGALLMAPMVVVGTVSFRVLVGLAAGACAGLVDGRRLRGGQEAPAAAGAVVGAVAAGEEVAASVPAPLTHRPAMRALAIGGAAMLCFNLIGALSLLARGDFEWRLDLPDGLKFGSACGILFGLVFGLRRGRRERGDTELSAGLARSRWSWSKSRRGAAWMLALVAPWCLVEQLRRALGVYSPFTSLAFFLAVGPAASVIGGLAGGLMGDVEEEPALPRGRRPGLRHALEVTVLAGWHAVAWVAAVLWLSLLLLWAVAGVVFGAGEWLAPAFAALAVGTLSVLALRGLDFVQHFTLRALLWAEGTCPLRWVRFLDQAVDCKLMHRVGPGYEFLHPWLLAELAAGAAAGQGAGSAAGGPSGAP
jgi:hypothetical protein